MTAFSEGLVAATAMSLYIYNVSPGVRAEKLYHYFQGECAEPDDLLALVDKAFWATHMAFPTAKVYLEQAMLRYGDEARERCRIESMPTSEIMKEFGPVGGE